MDSAILGKLKQKLLFFKRRNCYWFSLVTERASLGLFVQLPVVISALPSLCRGSLQPCALILSERLTDMLLIVAVHAT